MTFVSEYLEKFVGNRVSVPNLMLLGFFEALKENATFRDDLTAFLQAIPFQAAYFEFPPISKRTVSGACQFVILDSPQLASVPPNSLPFAENFLNTTEQIVDFKNLRGDAHLVVPVPTPETQRCTHLLEFLRTAPEMVISNFWERVAKVFIESAHFEPFWVSTAGLGVHWLHVRFDRRPKYFRFTDYKNINWNH